VTNVGRLDQGRQLLRQLELPTGRQPRAIFNPSVAEPLVGVDDRGLVDVDDAVRRAGNALAEWGSTPPAHRSAVLLALAGVLDANAEALGQLESLNTGKPIAAALDEMAQAADALRFFAGAARTPLGPAPGDYSRGHTSMLVREPVGVVAGIVPWNYPLLMAIWKLGPALAAGNTVILKPAELTPLTLLAFARLATAVLPESALTVLAGSGEGVGAALARHPGIAMVSLTGSIRAGRAVSAAAANTLKRVHLELGGKAPVIVFADADVERAIETVALMGYWNAGQECGAATRLLVHSSIHDAFLEGLTDATSRVTTGDPGVEDADIGPLASAAHRDRVAAMVEGARAVGAQVTIGGSALDRPGFFYAPTVIGDVPAGSEVDRLEIFGPVVTVRSFDDEEGVIATANDTDYGLSASVWTRDLARALHVSSRLEAGTVWINDHLALATEMPWGGFKQSGHGRDLSTLCLDEYVRTKHVMISSTR
jgi:aminobutyraldehyde dehydrogenase